ncbi:hypothetical protein B0T20DRAFT_419850 [Sordaria brevicollis]|uniref:Uncharacterized protein n=1 Tax=Sordaria brevicollis TaxID=83679 RepID=A0AAE0U9V3_SORBR|nr:hypothetical protein B0T20DRAFT_419850 [Sordaria brevicollis]
MLDPLLCILYFLRLFKLRFFTLSLFPLSLFPISLFPCLFLGLLTLNPLLLGLFLFGFLTSSPFALSLLERKFNCWLRGYGFRCRNWLFLYGAIGLWLPFG